MKDGGGGSFEEKKQVTTSLFREFTGTIVRRRSLGRCLAFCDVLLGTGNVAPLVFRKASFLSDNFPVKKADLPYSAVIHVVVKSDAEGDDSHGQVELRNNQVPFEVTHWKLLTNPHADAVELASVAKGTGISCTDYLRARREAFDSVKNSPNSSSSVVRRPKLTVKQQRSLSDTEKLNQHESHGSHRTKAIRSKVFSQWIIENLLKGDGSDRVLDVAGGKGLLSFALAGSNSSVHCTVVDPLIRRLPSTKQLIKQGKPVPGFVSDYFEKTENLDSLIQEHTCLVGLHPDQCTEEILDQALRHGVSVAVVPCCVFPCLFPMRVLSGGKSVRTYEDFLRYLLQKDPRLQQTKLPFDGKNECIYLRANE